MDGMKISFSKPCKECHRRIRDNDKAVVLATFKNRKAIERVYFHFDCYLKWFDRCVNERANKKINIAAPLAIEKFSKMFGLK